VTIPTRTPELLPSLWERLDFLRELSDRDVRVNPTKASQAIRCPFPERHAHGDRSPSCSITSTDQKWLVNCHGCGFAGDGIDLLAAIDGQPVADWMSDYGNRAAPLPHRPRPTPPPRRPLDPGYDPDELAAWLADCHAALLSGGASGHARAYCRARGLRADEVRRWRLGYAEARPPAGVTGYVSGRLTLPVPGAGFEARDLTGQAQAKYLTVGPKRPPWGMADLDPTRSPLLLVEGILDAIACRRVIDGDPLNHNTIALRSQSSTLQADDAQGLAELGFTTGYVGLDQGAKLELIDATAYQLLTAGIEPFIVRGPTEGDWGDLLKTSEDDMIEQFCEAVRLA
jgi:hypothetical protein